MHWISKTLLGIVVVAAIVAAILTTMLLDVRGGWMQPVEERQADLEQMREELRLKKLNVRDLENEVNRRMTPWGRSWEISPERIQLVDANQGVIMLDIGANAGLGLREQSREGPLPTIHLFGVDAEGTSNYLGEFRLTAVQPDQVAAQMVRKPYPPIAVGGEQVYPGEMAQWQVEAGIRIWEAVPASWQALHAELQALTAEAMQDVQDQQARLQTQARLIEESQDKLQRRMHQLMGDPNPVEGASQDTIDGLVVALRKEETARNKQLKVLNDLRHEFHAKYTELDRLLEQNRELESQLPQPQTDFSDPADRTVNTRRGSLR